MLKTHQIDPIFHTNNRTEFKLRGKVSLGSNFCPVEVAEWLRHLPRQTADWPNYYGVPKTG